MTTPEIRNTVTGSPAPASSDTLLKNFRATLDTRWEEFDTATMKEAQGRTIMGIGARTGRDSDESFIKAKSAFDQAKSMLANVKTDSELKASSDVLRKVEETLKSLTSYLASIKPEEKAKSHNIILAKTTADLANFKAEITGKEVDRTEANRAAEAERSIPRNVIAAGATATIVPFFSSAEAAEVVREGQKEVKGTFRTWISETLGFDKKTLIEDMAKQAKGESIGPAKKFKLFLFGLLNKVPFFGMMDDWTPEEKRLVGITPGSVPAKSGTPETERPQKENIVDDISLKAGYKGFVRMYYSTLDGFDKNLKPVDIDSAFQYSPFLSMKYSDAESLFQKYKSSHKGILSEPQFKGMTDAQGAFASLSLLVSGQGAEFLKKRYPNGLKDKSIKEILIGIKDSFDIAEGIENIEIQSMQDITGFMGKIGDKMDFSINSDGKISQDGMKVKAEKLGLTNGKLLAYTLVESNNTPVSKFSTDASVEELAPLDSDSKMKLKEILAFGKAIIPVLIKNCSFGEGGKYAEQFQNISPTLGDITKMYITLGGSKDFSTMSQAQHLYCYQRTWHFLGNTEFRGKYFDQPMIQSLMDDSKNLISPEMKDTLKRLMAKSVEKFFDKMQGIAKEIYGAMKWHHIASVGVILGAYLLWGKKLTWIGYGAAAASLTIVVSNILATLSSKDSSGRYTLPSGTKITAEDGTTAIIKDAERISGSSL